MGTPAEPLSWQLAAPAYVLDLRAGSRGARRGSENRHLARQDDYGPGHPRPCVLLVSRAADEEAAELEVLLRKVGIGCARLDAEAACAANLVVDLDAQAARLHGHWIRQAVTWVRHFSPWVLTDRRGPAYEMFLRDSWQALGTQLAAISGAVIRSEGPGLLGQLALAAASGIQVPRTVVATSPVRAREPAAAGPADPQGAALPLHRGRPRFLTGIFPKLLDSDALGLAAGVPGPPVIVQQYIDHELELRTYFVRGEVLAFESARAGRRCG